MLRCDVYEILHLWVTGEVDVCVCTCRIGAAAGVKGVPPEDDLLRDDGKTIDVALLRNTLNTHVLRRRPQVWQDTQTSCIHWQ